MDPVTAYTNDSNGGCSFFTSLWSQKALSMQTKIPSYANFFGLDYPNLTINVLVWTTFNNVVEEFALDIFILIKNNRSSWFWQIHLFSAMLLTHLVKRMIATFFPVLIQTKVCIRFQQLQHVRRLLLFLFPQAFAKTKKQFQLRIITTRLKGL